MWLCLIVHACVSFCVCYVKKELARFPAVKHHSQTTADCTNRLLAKLPLFLYGYLEDDLKHEHDLKKQNNAKNEDDPKNEDNHKNQADH